MNLQPVAGIVRARSASVNNAKRLVYLKLMEKYQNTDPFKFIICSTKIGNKRHRCQRPSDCC